MTLLLSRDDLARLLEVGAVLDAVEGAFAAYSSGRTVTPLRVAVEPPGQNGVLLAMPCAVAEPPALGTKIVSVFRDNPARGLPTITSVYLLSDYSSGAPLAVMDGTYLTGIRTAAGSAVATRLLAREDAETLGVFGTGVQARFHVLAISRVRPIRQVLVAATSPEKAAAFARWVESETGLAAQRASPDEASAADVIAACTTSPTPVVEERAVQPGAHVNAVGAFTPTTRELPTDLVRRAHVYVDSRLGALAEAGDLLIPAAEGKYDPATIVGEIGEVVLGSVPARRTAEAVTIYKSVGAAFLDAATARLAFERAEEERLGTSFSFG